VEFLAETGTACVTFPRKIRPFKRSGVLFFSGAPTPPGSDNVLGADGFFSIELLLLTFLPLGGAFRASLQQRMIFSKRKT
jgi:hypothetical protein